jgi:beta-lactamase class A
MSSILPTLLGIPAFVPRFGDLVRRAIIQSDSAATDFLIARLGGPRAVQQCLDRLNIKGLRLDRDERHLQTETVGLEWRAAFIDPTVLDAAKAAVPEASRERAFAAYMKDARDRSTPRGMVDFLYRLQDRRLLSESSTAFVLTAMEQCVTFPDRLKAGVPSGWKVAHKTGTSGSWKGVTVATNDVGIITAPDGTKLAVAVFVADSKATAAERASIIAKVSAAASAHFR